MNKGISNRLLLWLVIVLLVANVATLSFLWMGRPAAPPPGDGASKFLIKELQLDAKQQQQYQALVTEHRDSAEVLRSKIRKAKEQLFEMIKEEGATDSAKQEKVKEVSRYSGDLELLTLHHFEKLRAICTPEQQKKFDSVLQEITRMMGNPRPPMGPDGHQPPGPPPGAPGGPRAE